MSFSVFGCLALSSLDFYLDYFLKYLCINVIIVSSISFGAEKKGVRLNSFRDPVGLTCDPVGIRTQDPQHRRLLLYPAELPDHPIRGIAFSDCKVTTFFLVLQLLLPFLL